MSGVWLQALLSGLAVGAVYGLVGMGFSLSWSLTRTLALAHGDVVIGAVLLAVAAIVGATPVAGTVGAGASIGIVAISLALGGGLGAGAYLAVIRPLGSGGDAGVVGWSAGLLAVGLALRAAIVVIFPGTGVSVPDALHLSLGRIGLPGGAGVPGRDLAVLAIAVALAVAVDLVVRRTRAGSAMRAVADDGTAASLCGVDVRRVTLVAFVLAGLTAAAAGLLLAPAQAVGPDSGVLLGLDGAAAALLLRLRSLRAAVVGGLALGVAQQLLLAGGAAASVADLLPLVVLALAAGVRPDGLVVAPTAALR